MLQPSFLERWCRHLLNPQTEIQVTLEGAPGYYIAPERWRIQHQPPLTQHLIYYVVDGSFIAQVADQTIEITAGSVFWLRPGLSPDYSHSNVGRLTLYRFRLAVAGIEVHQPCLHVPDLPESRIWFEKIIAELNASDWQAEVRLRALLVCLFSDMRLPKESSGGGQRRLTRYEQAQITQLLTQQPHNHRLTPADMAAAVGLTPDYFARVFRHSYGRAPRRWLVEQRIELAKAYLLESDMTVTEIAEALGYTDVYFFSHQFKLIVGCSPLQFRHPPG